MATPVPPNKNPTPKEFLPPPPGPELSQPSDYKETVKAHQDHRVVSKFIDPCAKASKASLDCLERTHYNKAECYHFFKAYRECKKNWLEHKKRDRSA